jgi:hypothetical protein
MLTTTTKLYRKNPDKIGARENFEYVVQVGKATAPHGVSKAVEDSRRLPALQAATFEMAALRA